jgi:homocysteine S-methyltransferase
MRFAEALATYPLILTECAIAERLRRNPAIKIHPTLFNTPLLYDSLGRAKLKEIYLEYRQTARAAGLPVLLCAPTWRIDKKRLAESGFSPGIIEEAVRFIRAIGEETIAAESPFYTGGLIAPKNDCYAPEQALAREEAASYHAYQVQLLAKSQVDVIVAQTIPAVSEACGMGDAISGVTDIPYLMSFVINRQGNVLDGTPLAAAIDCLDRSVARPPLGYMVNCVYPTFLRAETQPELFQRVVGIQANSSSLDHAQLDGAATLQQDSLADWGNRMIELNSRYGVKILGGCCGTDNSYLDYIVANRSTAG